MVGGEERREPEFGAAKIKSDIEERAFGVDEGAAATKAQESIASSDGALSESDSPRAKMMPMWLLIGAVILAGLVWYFSDQAGDLTSAEGELRVITAEGGPVKVRPEEPGGLDVPNRDKYVYKSLTEESAEPEVENLLPPPEEPVESIFEAVEAGVDDAAAVRGAATSETETLLGASGDALKPESGSALEATGEQVVALKSEVDTATNQPKQAAAAKVEEVKSAAKSAPAENVSPAADAEGNELAPTADGARISPVADNFRVQFASARSEEGAEIEWRRLQDRHGELLAELNVRFVRANLGAKGIWYRARIGPFSDRAGADGLCDALKARGADCFVAKN